MRRHRAGRQPAKELYSFQKWKSLWDTFLKTLQKLVKYILLCFLQLLKLRRCKCVIKRENKYWQLMTFSADLIVKRQKCAASARPEVYGVWTKQDEPSGSFTRLVFRRMAIANICASVCWMLWLPSSGIHSERFIILLGVWSVTRVGGNPEMWKN